MGSRANSLCYSFCPGLLCLLGQITWPLCAQNPPWRGVWWQLDLPWVEEADKMGDYVSNDWHGIRLLLFTLFLNTVFYKKQKQKQNKKRWKKEKRKETRLHFVKKKERNQSLPPTAPLTKHCGGAAQAGSHLSSQGQAKGNAFPSFYRWELGVRGHGNGLGGTVAPAGLPLWFAWNPLQVQGLLYSGGELSLFFCFRFHHLSLTSTTAALLAATVPLTWYFMSTGLQSLLHKYKQPHVFTPSLSPALDKKLCTNWRARKLWAAGTHYPAFMLKVWIVLGVVPSFYPTGPYSWSDNAQA